MRVLFVVPYPVEGPSTRYRVEQYLPYLRQQGVEVTVARFIASADFYANMYRHGRRVYKAAYVLTRIARRFVVVLRAWRYDVIVIQREAMPYGPPIIERLLARSGTPLVFDFDDAIYLRRSSEANQRLAWLKQPEKTAEIVRLSRHVIAGNPILAAYAEPLNPHVTIIPTPIDLHHYPMRGVVERTAVNIGWVGTITNVAYLHLLDEVLADLARRFAITVTVVGGEYQNPHVTVINRPWRLANEIADLHDFDLGLMPLPDEEWTRGKCGFKILQYMGAGVPCVASPVGVNADIIQSGVNGFLADSPAEWQHALTALIQSPDLRQRMALAGRATIAEQYDLAIHAPRLLAVLRQAAGEIRDWRLEIRD